MYMGVSSYRDLPTVSSYADAERALDRWNSKPRRGRRRDSVNFYEDTRAIAFQLYDTEVVTWYPDDSFEIDNFGSLTTSGYARRFTPSGVHLRYPVERRDVSGGDCAIGFVGRDEDGGQVYALCQGDKPHFHPTLDGRWAPDEDTLYNVRMPAGGGADRGEARKLSAKYHLPEFRNWLGMAPQLMTDLEHQVQDTDKCLAALERRDWRSAVAFLPTIKKTHAFDIAQRARPLNILTAPGEYISMASFDKLRLLVWEDAGLLLDEVRKVWPRKLYDTRMRRARELEALGIDTSWGFS